MSYSNEVSTVNTEDWIAKFSSFKAREAGLKSEIQTNATALNGLRAYQGLAIQTRQAAAEEYVALRKKKAEMTMQLDRIRAVEAATAQAQLEVVAVAKRLEQERNLAAFAAEWQLKINALEKFRQQQEAELAEAKRVFLRILGEIAILRQLNETYIVDIKAIQAEMDVRVNNINVMYSKIKEIVVYIEQIKQERDAALKRLQYFESAQISPQPEQSRLGLLN